MENTCQECLNCGINMQYAYKLKCNLVPIVRVANWTAGLTYFYDVIYC